MSKKNKDEFLKIINDIENNNKFKELDNELHHGITRYGHSYRVAKATYKLSKTLKMNYIDATRAALLHDFYLDSDFSIEKSTKILSIHPNVALIKSHMFPLNGVRPKYKESWLVSLIDKSVAVYELYRFKFKMVINIWAIFLFNVITLNK